MRHTLLPRTFTSFSFPTPAAQAPIMSAICSASADYCGSCTGAQVAQMQAMFSSDQIDFLCTNLLSQTVNSTTGAAMLSGITSAQSTIQGLTEGLNCTYIFLCAALVFVMHAGFAMVRELAAAIGKHAMLTTCVRPAPCNSFAQEQSAARTP